MANWMIRENDKGRWSVFRDGVEQSSDFTTSHDAQKFVTVKRFAEATGSDYTPPTAEPEQTARPKKKRMVAKLVNDEYQVMSLDNSIVYRPGEMLGSDVMQGLCDDPMWHVTISR